MFYLQNIWYLEKKRKVTMSQMTQPCVIEIDDAPKQAVIAFDKCKRYFEFIPSNKTIMWFVVVCGQRLNINLCEDKGNIWNCKISL